MPVGIPRRGLRRCKALPELAHAVLHLLVGFEDPSHTAAGSQSLASALEMEFLWLPKRCPHLNPMDHLWRRSPGNRINPEYRRQLSERYSDASFQITLHCRRSHVGFSR
jgi:hypothetical protein